LLFAIFLATLFAALPIATCQTGGDAPRMDFSVMGGAAKAPENSGTQAPVVNGNVKEVASSPFAAVWQANFGWRLAHAGPVAVYFELPFTHVPSQTVNSVAQFDSGATTFPQSSTDSAYFFTPGFRFRFFNKAVSPYAVAGAGVERATLVQDGFTNLGTALSANSGSPTRNFKGVYDFGGGMDVKMTRLFALRTEFRDFVRTGETSRIVPVPFGVLQQVSQARQTFTVLGGLVVRF
ncbi:MAG: hypothetical protein ACHP79_08100, partial [Terriglobales bacterium]